MTYKPPLPKHAFELPVAEMNDFNFLKDQ